MIVMHVYTLAILTSINLGRNQLAIYSYFSYMHVHVRKSFAVDKFLYLFKVAS